MRIIEIVATRYQILRLNSISAGALSRPPWGAYSAPPDRLAAFKGPTTGEGREAKEGEGMARERKGEKEEGG